MFVFEEIVNFARNFYKFIKILKIKVVRALGRSQGMGIVVNSNIVITVLIVKVDVIKLLNARL